MRQVVHHIHHGAREMFSVDATQAVGAHPEEWSRVPWTPEMRAEAKPKLDAKLKAQKDAQGQDLGDRSLVLGANTTGAQLQPNPPPGGLSGGQTGDGKTDGEIVKRLQGDVDTAKGDVDKAGSDLEAAKAKNDDKATARAQAALDGANARLAEAQGKLDAAKKT